MLALSRKKDEAIIINDNIEVKILEIKQSVFKNNDDEAAALRKSLKERGVFLLNLMMKNQHKLFSNKNRRNFSALLLKD